MKKNVDEAVRLLNEALGLIVSVGLNPDFRDLDLGDSPWLPQTLEDASKKIVKAAGLLDG